MDNLKKQIKELIAENKTEKVFSILLDTLQGKDLQEYQNDIVLLQAKYATLKKDQRLYLAKREDITLEYTQLNNSLLQTVDVIFASIDKAHKAPTDNQAHQPKSDKSKKNLLLAMMTLSILVVLFFMIKYAIGQFDDRPAPVTIIVKSKNGIPLPSKGEVLLNFGGAQLAKELNNNNEAIFTEVPAVYFQQASKVKINFQDPQGEPYFAMFPDSIYNLERNSTIELLVYLSGIDGVFGIVKDIDSGNYLEGARVSILDIETFSNDKGWFELKLPEEKQQKFHTVRAELNGYQPWERHKIPLQTEKELIIQLKK